MDSLIKDLRKKIEDIKKDKLAKLTNDKTSFTREEVDYIASNLINTVLHMPVKTLKDSHLLGSREDKIQILRDLFGI